MLTEQAPQPIHVSHFEVVDGELLFVRKPQLQVRDYLVAGPYKKLEKYKPQDWNEIIVTVKDNVAHCECNGEVLVDALKLPETGPIGLEADRGQMEYRNLRLTETK